MLGRACGLQGPPAVALTSWVDPLGEWGGALHLGKWRHGERKAGFEEGVCFQMHLPGFRLVFPRPRPRHLCADPFNPAFHVCPRYRRGDWEKRGSSDHALPAPRAPGLAASAQRSGRDLVLCISDKVRLRSPSKDYILGSRWVVGGLSWTSRAWAVADAGVSLSPSSPSPSGSSRASFCLKGTRKGFLLPLTAAVSSRSEHAPHAHCAPHPKGIQEWHLPSGLRTLSGHCRPSSPGPQLQTGPPRQALEAGVRGVSLSCSPR